jgi:hypothetical protein
MAMRGYSERREMSISGAPFAALRVDFDELLSKTLRLMEERGGRYAEMSAKVKITLVEGRAYGGEEIRVVVKPLLEHKVTSVIQARAEASGGFSGEYEVLWDEETGGYVALPIDNGQETLFGGGDRSGLRYFGTTGDAADYTREG